MKTMFGFIGFAFAVILAIVACSASGETEKPISGDWRSEIKEIRMGTKASEEDPIALRRMNLVKDYLEEATGLPVKVYQASDYNGIVQALAAGQIDISTMGAGSYANVEDQIGDLADPILVRRSSNGLSAYYSTIVVRADSPYHSIEDLNGATLAFVDFNSTSGYIYPRWSMRKEGIEPDTHFGKTAMAGGHLQAMMALANGQFDATVVAASAGTPETGYGNGTLAQLARRGLINRDEYRMIWHAGPIPNSPYVIRKDLPQELQDIIRGAIAAMHTENEDASMSMGRLPGTNYRAVDKTFFKEILDMRKEEIRHLRTRATKS